MKDEIPEKSEGLAYEIDTNNFPTPRLDGHNWRQFGNMLACQSCPNEHVAFLPPNVYYAGLDANGNPKIIDRSIAIRPSVPPPGDGLEQTAPASQSVSSD